MRDSKPHFLKEIVAVSLGNAGATELLRDAFLQRPGKDRGLVVGRRCAALRRRCNGGGRRCHRGDWLLCPRLSRQNEILTDSRVDFSIRI
jgi:hypothetical protein